MNQGYLEFEEFCQLSAKFLVEEDEESMKSELKEAFRIYDKEGDQDLMDNKASSQFYHLMQETVTSPFQR